MVVSIVPKSSFSYDLVHKIRKKIAICLKEHILLFGVGIITQYAKYFMRYNSWLDF